MKKNKYIILSSMLFLINIQPISAACTQEEINGFKRVEDEYTVKYEIDKSTKEYYIYFNASKPNIYDYTIYTDNGFECETIDDVTAKCSSFPSGEYKIEIVGQTETCNDVLKTMTLKLPKYNKLSEDPLCEGIEEFVLCNPSYEKEIDYDTFVSRVETYKKNHATTKTEEEQIDEDNEKTNKTLTKIIDYLKEHWIEITIIIVFVVLVLVTIIVTAKSVRKSRYLE